MAYSDIGFDEFLNRDIGGSNGGPQSLNPSQFDFLTEQISGDKIDGGLIISPDGKVKLDLDKGLFNINNGVQDLISLGVLPDGNTGLLIQDSAGNTLMQISEGNNIIKSSSGAFVIDIGKEQFIVYENGIPRIILGKFPGLF